jgi:hypothetical protein
MRKFSSYGPIDKDLYYYVPREELIQKACHQLTGENPEKGGHYITVWAPRQQGKTWIMREVADNIRQDGIFEARIVSMQSAKTIETDQELLEFFIEKLENIFSINIPQIKIWRGLSKIFRQSVFEKPVILILDEFDALKEDFINKFANEFRDMFIERQNETDKPSHEKNCLLHGLALIGVRSVLGIENVKGSPFNVQRSLHIPNLTYLEVESMFKWYERESRQKVEQEVIDRLFDETQGQPGLVSWFGELLTEGFEQYVPDKTRPIHMRDFEYAYAAATQVLPNNNILNIISKAKQEQHKPFLLELFKTTEKVPFKFDDPHINFLYMNGVIDKEETGVERFVKFPCPFVQKRLFNYFSHELFSYMGQIFEPFVDMSDTITEAELNIKNLIRRYEKHLQKNRHWMLKDAPRRSDLKIYEAVFHFNLYEYLVRFFGSYKTSRVWPEFPTGNGKVDILIQHGGLLYPLEVKSYKDEPAYQDALRQAARYGKSLGGDRIYLIVFVEYIPDEYRLKYEVDYQNEDTGVTVSPVFAATGE